MKSCSTCKSVKEFSNFYRDKRSKDGLYSNCKKCAKISNKTYRMKDPEKHKERNKKYRLNNLEKCQQGRRDRYYTNREVEIARSVKYITTRRKEDTNFKLINNLRTRLYNAIKRNQKSGSAIRDLGCSIEELKQHLESQFKSGMTWDNYGEWHIDHIKPLSSFDLTKREELIEACNFSNLQPLWAEENLKKKDREVA